MISSTAKVADDNKEMDVVNLDKGVRTGGEF